MESKEIFSILYHNNRKESINHLRNLIDELEKRNKCFIIYSHSTIPEDIISKCEGYFYDSNNYLFDSGSIYTYWIELGESVLYSPYLYYGALSNKNYALAAIKNILNSLVVCYQLGYDILHSVEYDCIPNFDDLEENTKLLSSENKAVVYKDDNSEMMGHVFSLKLDKLIDVRWNDQKWTESIKKYNSFSEKFLLSLIKDWTSDKVIVKAKNKQTNSKVSSANSLQTVIFEENNTLKVFLMNSSSSKIENISLYYSFGKFNIELYPNNWKILNLGSPENHNFLDVFLDDKLLRKWDISTDDNYSKYVRVNKIELKK